MFDKKKNEWVNIRQNENRIRNLQKKLNNNNNNNNSNNDNNKNSNSLDPGKAWTECRVWSGSKLFAKGYQQMTMSSKCLKLKYIEVSE